MTHSTLADLGLEKISTLRAACRQVMSTKLVDGRTLLTTPATVDDCRCYTVTLTVHIRSNSGQSSVCVDNTW